MKDVNQLNRILDVVGYPSQDLLQKINQDARHYLEQTPSKPPRVNFAEYFNEIQNPEAIDLIEKMLQLDPAQRITCEQALAHPYLNQFHDEEDEPCGEPFDDRFEAEEYSVADWKMRVFDEIRTFVAPPIDQDQ